MRHLRNCNSSKTQIHTNSYGMDIQTLEIRLSPSEINCVARFIESPLKMMKYAYFILKAFFILKIFKVLSWLFGQVERTPWLERLISKFITSQSGYQTVPIHILHNISGSKNNHTMKFYFILKAFFVLKIFKVLSWLFGHVERTPWLEKLISKFMTSQTG